MYSIVVFVPQTHGDIVRKVLAENGAGSVGPYDSGSFTTSGTGRFRPLEGAHPAIGEIGHVAEVPEERIETEVAASKIKIVLEAVKNVHPYEAPSIQVTPLTDYTTFLEPIIKIEKCPVNKGSFSIVLEGLDGVGKSTISDLLQKSVPNFVKLHTPPTSIIKHRKWFDDKGGDMRKSFYMVGNFLVGDEMLKQMEQGKSVIIDRYYASTVAYSLGALVSLPPAGDNVYEWPSELPKPDLMILLSLPHDVRIYRCSQRQVPETDEESTLRLSQAKADNINEAYRRLGCTEISALGDATAVVDRIVQCLKFRLFPTVPSYV